MRDSSRPNGNANEDFANWLAESSSNQPARGEVTSAPTSSFDPEPFARRAHRAAERPEFSGRSLRDVIRAYPTEAIGLQLGSSEVGSWRVANSEMVRGSTSMNSSSNPCLGKSQCSYSSVHTHDTSSHSAGHSSCTSLESMSTGEHHQNAAFQAGPNSGMTLAPRGRIFMPPPPEAHFGETRRLPCAADERPWNYHAPASSVEGGQPAGQDFIAAELNAQATKLEFQAAQLRLAAQSVEMGAKMQGNAFNAPELHRTSFVGAQKDIRTTLILRNLPNDYGRHMLLELLEEAGFAGRYNFVYLPVDFKRWAGLGYAFVNMVDHKDARGVIAKLNGYSAWKRNSLKVCEVTWSEPLQGLDIHLERYRNSPIMHPEVPDEAKPALFMNGVRVPFVEPTKRLRPPRVKR